MDARVAGASKTMMKVMVLALASCHADMERGTFPRTTGEEMAIEVWWKSSLA